MGTILGAIEQRLGWIGQLVIRFIGLAWAVATFFVVPVLVSEGARPVTALRRSVAVLTKTWGEGLTGNFVISVLSWLVTLPRIALTVGGIIAGAALQSLVLIVVTIVVAAMLLLTLAIVGSAMRQVFLAGLYRYATTGEIPQGFSEESMRLAMAAKE